MPTIDLAEAKRAVSEAIAAELAEADSAAALGVGLAAMRALDDLAPEERPRIAVGVAVRIIPHAETGEVRRLVEADGQLHTVAVYVPSIGQELLYSPRELELVR